MSIVPVQIRPHLIPFFFQEFDGEEASYLNQKVTAVKFSSKSSWGKMIRMFMVKVNMPKKVDHYQLYLRVADSPQGQKTYEGNFYKFESGASSFLELPPDVNHDINSLLEDIFRMAFVFYVDGYMVGGKRNIVQGINSFIDKYELLEFGFCNEKLRQLYYREIKKGNRCSRFQKGPANRVTNYTSAGTGLSCRKL
jgi:hypothetical protein